MNSFETDLKRAIISIPFLVGVALEFFILLTLGYDSDLFKVSIPVVSTLPYSTAWLLDHQNSFIKFYVPRSGVKGYIWGKFLACGISGGLVEWMGCFLYTLINHEDEINLGLIFVSGALWAVLAATLAAWSDSRYIAYGGSFVVYYILVILHDRYFEDLYCLYPYEWLKPQHTWVFDEQGIVILILGLILVLGFFYYGILRRCIERV